MLTAKENTLSQLQAEPELRENFGPRLEEALRSAPAQLVKAHTDHIVSTQDVLVYLLQESRQTLLDANELPTTQDLDKLVQHKKTNDENTNNVGDDYLRAYVRDSMHEQPDCCPLCGESIAGCSGHGQVEWLYAATDHFDGRKPSVASVSDEMEDMVSACMSKNVKKDKNAVQKCLNKHRAPHAELSYSRPQLSTPKMTKRPRPPRGFPALPKQ